MMSLYLMDIDGTVVRSFLREGAPRAAFSEVDVLPGRRELVGWLRQQGKQIALVTNQGGVALGYQTPREVAEKITGVLMALGLPTGVIRVGPGSDGVMDSTGFLMRSYRVMRPCAYVSFGLAQATIDRYKVQEDDVWRKPGAGMLLAAMMDYGVAPEDTTFVGDMESDAQAAAAAGVAYCEAEAFFADMWRRWTWPNGGA